MTTIWVTAPGERYPLVNGDDFDIDPGDDDALQRLANKLEKDTGVKSGDMEMDVRGGSRPRTFYPM